MTPRENPLRKILDEQAAHAKAQNADGDTTIPAYRSAISDAIGRPITLGSELRVWLDDDVEDRRAPEGWLHVVTAREACLLLLTGQVVELSLDHDLSDDQRFGYGSQVIDFLDEQHGTEGRWLWPRDGITLHTANSQGRDQMRRAIRTASRRHKVDVSESLTKSGKPRFLVNRPAASGN